MTKWEGMELCFKCCKDPATSLQLHYTWVILQVLA